MLRQQKLIKCWAAIKSLTYKKKKGALALSQLCPVVYHRGIWRASLHQLTSLVCFNGILLKGIDEQKWKLLTHKIQWITFWGPGLGVWTQVTLLLPWQRLHHANSPLKSSGPEWLVGRFQPSAPPHCCCAQPVSPQRCRRTRGQTSGPQPASESQPGVCRSFSQPPGETRRYCEHTHKHSVQCICRNKSSINPHTLHKSHSCLLEFTQWFKRYHQMFLCFESMYGGKGKSLISQQITL